MWITKSELQSSGDHLEFVTELRTSSSEYESDDEGIDMEELDPRNQVLDPQGNAIETLQHRNVLTPLTPILHQHQPHTPTPEPEEPCIDMQLVNDLNRPAFRVLTKIEDVFQDINERHLFNDREGFDEAFQRLIAAYQTLDGTEGTDMDP